MKILPVLNGISGRTARKITTTLGPEKVTGFDYARDHLTVSTKTGTWAWFVIGDQEWATLDTNGRRSMLNRAIGTWIDLIDFDVDLHGTWYPFPIDDWIAARKAERPTVSRQETRDALLEDLMRLPVALQAREPVFFAAVKLTTWAIPRELLPAVLGTVPAPAPNGRVNEVRDKLRHVTRTLADAGLDAHPTSSGPLSWLDETRRRLGHPKPQLSDPLYACDLYELDDAKVVGEEFGKTARIVCPGPDGPETVHAAVRHIASIEDRTGHDGRLNDGETQDVPWLAWFLHCDYPVEVVASWRVYDGDTVNPAAKRQRKVVSNSIDHLRNRGYDIEDNILHAEVAANRAVAETARKPADGTRVWGRIMVAVTGPTEQAALDAARTLTREARAEAGIELVAGAGVTDDVLRFRPGAHLPHDGRVRRMNARMATAAVPGASWKAGSDTGVLLGAAAGSPSVTTWDPFEGVKTDQPGMWVALGTSGHGKTTLGELIATNNLLDDYPGTFYDPSGLVRELVKVPELDGLVKEYPLTAGRPGLLMPSLLVLEPDRYHYDSDTEWEDAKSSARSERVNLLVDAALMHLPWAMVNDHTLGVQACAERAAARVGGSYGTHSRELIDALRNDTADIGKVMADQLESVSEGVGALVFPSRDVDADELARFGSDTLGAIVTTPGLKMPDTPDRYEWTQENRQSFVIAAFGARLAARRLWADRTMKWLIADEAGITTAGFSSWKPFMLRGAYDARKFGASFGILGQTPSIVSRIETNISSLIGSAFVGRLSPGDAPMAASLLGLPEDSEWVNVIPTLPRGQFVMKHWPREINGQLVGQVRRQAVDLSPWPSSFQAAVYNRPAERVGRIPDRLRGNIPA